MTQAFAFPIVIGGALARQRAKREQLRLDLIRRIQDDYAAAWQALLKTERRPKAEPAPEPKAAPAFKPAQPANAKRNERARILGGKIVAMNKMGDKHEIIAAALGCSASSVERHLKQHRRAMGPKAGPERDAAIMELHRHGKGTREITLLMGIPAHIVQETRVRHGVRLGRGGIRAKSEAVFISAALVPKVAQLRAEGLTQPVIAARLGVTIDAVKYACKRAKVAS